MTRWAVAVGLVAWAGATLLLSSAPALRRVRLADRLRPYAPGGLSASGGGHRGNWSGTRSILGPLAASLASRLGTLLGGDAALEARLRRLDLDEDAPSFRGRQLRGTLVAAAVSAAVVLVVRPDPLFGGAILVVPIALAALWPEQRVRTADERWRQQLLWELPVVAEQLGMLLSSGYSLGGAVARLAARGEGVCARELGRVGARIRQGLSEVDALREWAARADVGGLDRLVSVLALNWEAADLGGLISAEARSIRREAQRRHVEVIERRAQQVWIPVTVATLLPGVIFMAVPFVDAMGRITGR